MKTIIQTPKAPTPIGPYNQAILVDNTLYASGQIALDPKTMELVNRDIETETNQVMKNLSEVLKAAGMDFVDVVKATIFLYDMGDFAKVNKVYGGYFDHKVAPARETVQVTALPKNVRVEISVIAIR
ncbi:MAG: RidA family protein [Flavobacteriaceae bacterium]|nr:RidA family protein [Flavobacteriaceae bacterium]